MKIIKTCGSTSFNGSVDGKETDTIFCDNGCEFKSDGKSIKLAWFSSEKGKRRGFTYQGKSYQCINDLTNNEDHYVNIDDPTDELFIDEQFKEFFKYSPPSDNLDEKFLGYDDELYLCDITSGEKLLLPVNSVSGKIQDDNILIHQKRENRLTKLNFEGDVIWEFEFGFKAQRGPYMNPAFHNNDIIVFHGPTKKERLQATSRTEFTNEGGCLFSIKNHDGVKNWSVELKGGLHDFVLNENKIYAISGSSIFAFDCEDGSVIKQVDLPVNPHFIVGGYSHPYIFVDESFIYISSPLDAKFFILDKNSFDIIRTIEAPNGQLIGSYKYTSPISGKHYFDLLSVHTAVPKFICLEVDKNDLDSEVTYEEEPKHSIELIQAQNLPDEKEVLIEFVGASIDDVVRFGEIYSRDEASRYSFNYMKSTYGDREFVPEPAFNGVVRLKVSECSSDQELVENYLKVMEKRFEKWNENEGCYAANDKKKLTILITETETTANTRYREEEPEEELTDSDLVGYVISLENGDASFLENEGSSEELRRQCQQVLEKEVSPKAHYLLGLHYICKEDTERSKEHRLKAAYLGYCAAIIDHAYKQGFDDLEVLGLLKAMDDAGESLASAGEDYALYMRDLSLPDKQKVEEVASKVGQSLKKNNLTFEW